MQENPTPSLTKIGMIGGMSWHSTMTYYDVINSTVEAETAGAQNAEIVLYSVNSAQVVRWLNQRDFDTLAGYLCAKANALESAGADFVLLACNSAHIVAKYVANATALPFIDISDAVSRELTSRDFENVGVLSTAHTRHHGIYDRALQSHGVSVIYPPDDDLTLLTDIIHADLCFKKKHRESSIGRMANDLIRRGADAIILGCTELSLVSDAAAVGFPLLDSAMIHATSAGKIAVNGLEWWYDNGA